MPYSAKTSLRSGRVKLAMGGRQYARLMDAIGKMARRAEGHVPAALSALVRRETAAAPHLAEGTQKLRDLLYTSGTGAGWRDLASQVGNEKLIRDETFRLIPRARTSSPPYWATLQPNFESFVAESRKRALSGVGRGPGGIVTPEAIAAGKAAPVPPGWGPAGRAALEGDRDVLRGEYLRAQPNRSYTQRLEKDLATVLHMPKGGMYLPPGAKRGGIPFADEINPFNELTHVGAGRGAYLFRGGGINTKLDDHVFLSGNAAVAKHYSSGVAGMQSQRNNARRIGGGDNDWAGVPTTRPETKLPAPRLLQWFKSTVARTPQGQQLGTRPHMVGLHGTQGMPYEEIANMSRLPEQYNPGAQIDSLPSYQVDFPARNLGPQQSRVPRGFNHILGKEQVDRFGLRPHQNAAGWAYDTPQGTYVMRGREAFEKDFHTRDGRAAMRASGQTPPRNQPLPLPLHDPNAKPRK